jgi:hypothetical protein
MPCQCPYTDMCTGNLHKLKWECHQSKPDPCHFRKEAGRAEKRKRELELKQKLEEEEHKRLMQRAEEQLTWARLSWMRHHHHPISSQTLLPRRRHRRIRSRARSLRLSRLLCRNRRDRRLDFCRAMQHWRQKAHCGCKGSWRRCNHYR